MVTSGQEGYVAILAFHYHRICKNLTSSGHSSEGLEAESKEKSTPMAVSSCTHSKKENRSANYKGGSVHISPRFPSEILLAILTEPHPPSLCMTHHSKTTQPSYLNPSIHFTSAVKSHGSGVLKTSSTFGGKQIYKLLLRADGV